MRTISINKYLVPFDFTRATKDAFDYAISLCRSGGGEIVLVHLVKNESEIPGVKKEIENILSLEAADVNNFTSYRVMEGNIYSDINQIAETAEASAIIMGKHGDSGLQKIFGSNALQVISDSHIPFIVTQEEIPRKKIDTIVMPFNFERESLQITQFAISMAKKFDATMHLVGYKDEDSSLKREMEINQAIVEKQLKKEGVKYVIADIPGGRAYHGLLMSYAYGNGADLIATAYFDNRIAPFFNSFVDDLLSNDHHIPVLTVNGPAVMNYKPKLNYVPA